VQRTPTLFTSSGFTSVKSLLFVLYSCKVRFLYSYFDLEAEAYDNSKILESANLDETLTNSFPMRLMFQ